MRLKSLVPFLFFAVLTVGMTWPITLHFSTAVNDYGDPLFNTWTLAWNHHQLLTDPLHYFDTNIFYPQRWTLAYSEHLFSSALLSFPAYWLGASPIAVYNFVLLASFALSGWGMYLLVRELTGHTAASLLAGVAFAFSAYRFSQLPHLQILTVQWMPFAWLFLHRALKTPSWKNFLLFGLFFLLQLLTCNYLAMIFTVATGVWILGMVPARWGELKWKGIGRLTATVALAGGLFLPFAYPYYQLKQDEGFSRSLQDVKQYSAKAENYLGVTTKHKFYPKKLMRKGGDERHLFFGFTAMGLALLAFLFRDPRFALARRVYLVILVLAVLLSMGVKSRILGLSLGGQPYHFLHEWVPGFDGMRVPARFAVAVGLALAILAGIGAAGLFQRVKRRGWSVAFAVVLGLGILADGWCVPLRFKKFDSPPPPVHLWLAGRDDVRALVHFPLYKSEVAYKEMNHVYWSLYNWKKMVNGYSGFFPPGYDAMRARLQAFPSKETLDELRRLGVNYVVFHFNKYPGEEWKKQQLRLEKFSADLEEVHEIGSAKVYRIREEQR